MSAHEEADPFELAEREIEALRERAEEAEASLWLLRRSYLACQIGQVTALAEARREERERCAKVAETTAIDVTHWGMTMTKSVRRVQLEIATAIRSLPAEE